MDGDFISPSYWIFLGGINYETWYISIDVGNLFEIDNSGEETNIYNLHQELKNTFDCRGKYL